MLFDIKSDAELIEALQCDAIETVEEVQSLWSGYGKIVRARVINGVVASVIIKIVNAPSTAESVDHPRGWNTQHSHLRKLQSYQVEERWYKHWAAACSESCRVAKMLWSKQLDASQIIVMEDLDSAGFSRRVESPTHGEIEQCLRWLANFHATFLEVNANNTDKSLWLQGGYWHLATRQDEWNALAESEIKSKAQALDHALHSGRYTTLVHGDAKLANFCFHHSQSSVAAVDFQYVGGGCGIKDVVLFFSSSLSSDDCDVYAEGFLKDYFGELNKALLARKYAGDINALEREWRNLYSLAWADFSRFLMGWKPGHWKLHGYCEKQTKLALSII